MTTKGEIIKCRAAVLWEPKKALTIETIDVHPPKAGEVRIKVISNSLCFSDVHCYLGHLDESFNFAFPCILGHEACGIVESIGEGVTDVVPGDTVLSSFMPNCGKCKCCLLPYTNICSQRRFDEKTMADGTTRFSLNGKPIYHFLGISALSEYTVIPESQVVKINPNCRKDRVCIIACGFGTGFGTAVNVAEVREGSTVGVWGLGTIGLSAVTGAKFKKAKTIIGVDVIDSKEKYAKEFGCTHFLNSATNKNFDQEILKLTDGLGLDYGIECVGNIKATEGVLKSIAPWGKAALVGVYKKGESVNVKPGDFLIGKTIKGALFGGYKSKISIPGLVQLYMEGKINLDQFFTHTIKLEEINDAIDWLIKGEALRSVVIF